MTLHGGHPPRRRSAATTLRAQTLAEHSVRGYAPDVVALLHCQRTRGRVGIGKDPPRDLWRAVRCAQLRLLVSKNRTQTRAGIQIDELPDTCSAHHILRPAIDERRGGAEVTRRNQPREAL